MNFNKEDITYIVKTPLKVLKEEIENRNVWNDMQNTKKVQTNGDQHEDSSKQRNKTT